MQPAPAAESPVSSQARPRRRLLWFAPALAILVPTMEMVFMASPFAAYFYGVYSPVLTWTQTSPDLIWLADFFVPHLTRPKSAVVRVLFDAPKALLYVGLISFFVHAGYLYWTKFKKRTVARALLYRYVRHPQYLSLAAAGLGLVFHWPRFINLALYLVMLGGYHALARSEEARMERAHGESYRAYKAATPMFLPRVVANGPGILWERLPASPFGRAAAVIVLATATFATSFALRAAGGRARDYEVLPGTNPALVVFLRVPEGEERRSIREAVARLVPSARKPGTVPLFYATSRKEDLEHVLIDSGFSYKHVKRAGLPDASAYVIEGAASYPCPATCKLMAAPGEAMSARALRRPVRLYYRPNGHSGMQQHALSPDALFPHAMMPSL